MEKIRILAVLLAYGHDTTIPDSFRKIKCYHNFSRDFWLQAILICSSGVVDPSKIYEGMSLEDCPIDMSRLSTPAKDCESVGTYASELELTVRNKSNGKTRVVSAIVRSGTAMGQTEEDYQIQEDAAGGLKRKKKQKKKPSTRRGNSIGKRNTSHSGSNGHKQERFASTTSSRYILAPDANVKQSPSVKEAQLALLHSMFQLGDDEEIASVELEDRVAFSLSDEGIRNGVSSAIFSRGCVDDGEEEDGIESRAKRRSFMGFVVERAVSLLISPRFHFNRTNLSFEQYRWGRAVTDCSAAWFEKMEWRLSNFESLSPQMKSSLRKTIGLAKFSNGDLSRYQSLRAEDERGVYHYEIQTTELMHLFLSASQDESLLKRIAPRAKDYLGIVPEVDPAELELARKIGLPENWTARKRSTGKYDIHSPGGKRHFWSIKAAKDYLGIVPEVDPAELELARKIGLPENWTACKRGARTVFYSPGRSTGWPSKTAAFRRAKWLSQQEDGFERAGIDAPSAKKKDKPAVRQRTAKPNAKSKRKSVGVRDGAAKRKLFDDDALTVKGILAEAAALAVRQREAREAQKSANKKVNNK